MCEELMDDKCCIICKQSLNMSSKNEDCDDELFCKVHKKYVAEDDYCKDYND